MGSCQAIAMTAEVSTIIAAVHIFDIDSHEFYTPKMNFSLRT
jgi:hypothetical protein